MIKSARRIRHSSAHECRLHPERCAGLPHHNHRLKRAAKASPPVPIVPRGAAMRGDVLDHGARGGRARPFFRHTTSMPCYSCRCFAVSRALSPSRSHLHCHAVWPPTDIRPSPIFCTICSPSHVLILRFPFMIYIRFYGHHLCLIVIICIGRSLSFGILYSFSWYCCGRPHERDAHARDERPTPVETKAP